MKKVLITLFVVLTLAACDLSYDPYAALQGPATPTPAPQPTDNPTATATATEPAKICKVTAEVLHVRSGAGLSYAVIGYLYAGDIVTIETQRGAWFEIGAGWVHSHYCEVTK